MIRGAFRRWRHGAIAAWYHPAFRIPIAGVASTLGIEPRRADHVLTWMLDRDVLTPEMVFEAPMAPWRWMRMVHDEAYLDTLDTPEAVARVLGVDERVVSVGSILELWRRGVGATVAATRWTLDNRQPAVNLQGGYHHAYRDRGVGFCALNDVAIALSLARLDGFEGYTGVLDLDAHPPDGIADILGSDERVRIASVACESAWDALPIELDRRLPAGSTDAAYQSAVDEAIAAVGKVDLLFYIAGADPLAGDRLGGLAVSEAGLRERDRRVMKHFDGTPTVLLPAGGYTSAAWRVFAGTVAEAAGDGRPVPEGYDPLRRQTRDVAKALDLNELGGDDWFTEEDLLFGLNVPVQTEPRFLGLYTAHGIEYALTRYGLLDALRRMGFEQLEVEMVAEGPPPHQLRVTAEVQGARERLVDLSLSIRKVGEFDTLFVEWLELKDPRLSFTDDRPRLPGQDKPGLGLAAESGQLMLRVAERLGLAGVSFIPSHFHVAWISRRAWTHVDPQDRAWFAGLCRFFEAKDITLLQATNALAGSGIPTEHGEAVTWKPTLMAMPLEPDLRAYLDEGNERVASYAEGFADLMIWTG